MGKNNDLMFKYNRNNWGGKELNGTQKFLEFLLILLSFLICMGFFVKIVFL